MREIGRSSADGRSSTRYIKKENVQLAIGPEVERLELENKDKLRKSASAAFHTCICNLYPPPHSPFVLRS